MIFERVTTPSINLRLAIIERALAVLQSRRRLGVVEIGCMFNEREGLSTFAVAQALKSRPGSVFASIEYDADHIDACKGLIAKRDPELLKHVDFYYGHSIDQLPKALASMPAVDLALIDAGAQPEIVLQELEAIAECLSDDAICLIDDAQELKPTVAYPHPRPWGKATLILPMLVIADYRARQTREGHGARSPTVGAFEAPFLTDLLKGRAYRVFGRAYGHQVLAIARPEILDVLGDVLTIKPQTAAAQVPRGMNLQERAIRAVKEPHRILRRVRRALA